jgi:hypothetical protein
MKKLIRTIAVSTLTALAFMAALIGTTAPAQAQATRTWVSGVGDDVNPCSRTAPCKTFAGAISKTAAGGEINCLDPGGFGAVTINKSLTINCYHTEGGALAGGNGITVNDSLSATPNTAVVFLRGLDIFGVNPPANGVRFISGAALYIEDSVIRRFNAANSFGVSFQPAAAAELYIRNTTIADNGSGATGGGVLVQPTGANGSSRVMMENVRLLNNANIGLSINTTGATSATGTRVVIDGGILAGNNGNGVTLLSPAGTQTAFLTVRNASVVNNGATGLRADGSGALMLVGNTAIQNNVTGLSAVNGASLLTNGDNALSVNNTDGAFTGPAGKS